MKDLKKVKIILLMCCILIAGTVFGQKTIVKGRVLNEANEGIKNATISVIDTKFNTKTDKKGYFEVEIPANKTNILDVSVSAKAQKLVDVPATPQGSTISLEDIVLLNAYEKNEITFTKKVDKERAMQKQVDPKDFMYQPNPSGDIKSIIEKFAGVSSNNELSTQYNVRGGNYDENLVYINDIEIFRPLLVRSGQQEGLSIINPNLVKNLNFSAGGFEARYGDKLSSVLDIQYKRPDTFHVYASASLLGGGISFEGTSKNRRFKFLGGGRFKTNRYLLSSLDIKGQYQPKFFDFQSLLSYDLRDNLSISWFTYYGQNMYLSKPVSQSTSFGTVNQTYQLNIDFAGQDILNYSTLLNAVTLEWLPNKNSTLKWINSVYFNDEREQFDIIAQYRLDELDNNLSSANFGKSKGTLGFGGYLNHARNKLQYLILNSEVKYEKIFNNSIVWESGAKIQRESFWDKLSEYRYIDSADYSVPQVDSNKKNSGNLPVYELIDGRNNQSWNRYSAYTQSQFKILKELKGQLITGVRANYWDYNQELLISPRAQFQIEPYANFNRRIVANNPNLPDSVLRQKLKTPFKFKLAGGIYQQPPFYRELRTFSGILNPAIRAQKSYQVIAGTDFPVRMWNRPFRFTAEAYYKGLWDLIPYDIDNVRIRYYAKNNSVGYATGMDFMLNGELVKDNPSYVSLSIMKTAEDLKDDSYTRYNEAKGKFEKVYPGYIPRPTDQRFRFAMFFQDYLPNRPSYKAHISFVYASGLPFGPPDQTRYKDTARMPAYRRVDIGFSRLMYDRKKMPHAKGFVRAFSSIWASIEVFNTFDINNTISYLWVQDISGGRWGIPNYLTGRRFNLHLEAKF